MSIAIVIATYQRPDGKTPSYLLRTLNSITRQTFQDYQIYLIGDAYADDIEFRTIATNFPKVNYINLEHSVEREKYGLGNDKIWCAGGVTAANTGIEWALKDSFEYICHQAHDDYWEPNHLELINKVIQEKHPIFICTLSTYGSTYLPGLPVTNEILPYYPIDGKMIASSACIKYTETQLRVVDRFATEGITSPADAYLWERLRNEMKATGKEGYVVTTITCHHDEEGYSMGRSPLK